MQNRYAAVFVCFLMIFGCAGNPVTPVKTTGALIVNPSTIPAWISGQEGSYNIAFMASGVPPYQCALASGSALPDGLSLSGDCTINGAHTLPPGTPEAISPPFIVMISDSSSPKLSAEMSLSIPFVTEKPALEPVEGYCTAGEYCSTLIAVATKGTPEYVFSSGSFANGAPPMGMTIGTDGYLQGTPASAGTYTFSVCVADSIGLSDCATSSIVVDEPFEVPINQDPDELVARDCYVEGIDDPLPGELPCCQYHSWCNGPGNCCQDVPCKC